jgi:AbrB family looped-hinge helix DNA binding protein
VAEIYEKGQVVIPKHIRDILGLAPGTQVNFRIEDKKVIMEPYDWIEELESIRSHATMSDEEVEKSIIEMRKKRQKEWLNVP